MSETDAGFFRNLTIIFSGLAVLFVVMIAIARAIVY